MSKRPRVSIVTITYNQEKYIRDALESFIAQKTSFDIEIVVGDDCSTDGTPAILKDYARRYPRLLKLTLRERNVGAIQNSLATLRLAKGEYIALCEGDDYWTNPNKLQLQVDFLDAHSTCSLCFHPVKVVYEHGEERDAIFPEIHDSACFTTKELLRWNFIQTNSVMYRRQRYDSIPSDVMPLDWYLHLYHAKFGKIGFIDKVMAVYRRHPGGVWWSTHSNLDELWKKYGTAYMSLYVALLGLYGDNPEYAKILSGHMKELSDTLVGIDKKYHTTLLEATMRLLPVAASSVIAEGHDREAEMGQLQKQKDEVIATKDKEIAGLQSQLLRERDLLKQREDELMIIKKSKVWRARNKVAKFMGKNVR